MPDFTISHLLVAEALSVTSSFIMYHQLAYKRRSAWIYYAFSGITLIYIMVFKEAWVTVINQSMMTILCVKNFASFGKEPEPWHRYFDYACFPVFLGSLLFIKQIDVATFFEVALWGSIIFKTITFGRGQISGWKWQILQQSLSIVFGWQRGIYLYVFKSVVQLIQAIWGYWKWTKSHAER